MNKLQLQQPSKSIWVIYKILAWLFIICILFTLFRSFFNVINDAGDFTNYSYTNGFQTIFNMFLLFACIAAITNRNWAPQVVTVAASCLLIAVSYAMLPTAIYPLIEQIRMGNSIVLGGGNHFLPLSMANPILLVLVWMLGAIIAFTLAIVSYRIAKYQLAQTTSSGISIVTPNNKHLLYTALVIFALGIFCKVIDWQYPRQHYAMITGSVFQLITMLILILWQIRLKQFSLPAFIITASVILVLASPVYNPKIWVFILWLPFLIPGVIALLKKPSEKLIPAISIVVPLLMVLIILFLPIRIFLRFTTIYETKYSRPSNFPEYLKAPDDAFEFRYDTFNQKSISFMVQQPFPAIGVIDFISQNLQAGGFTKLEYTLFNPHVKSSHTTSFSDLESSPTYDKMHQMQHCTWVADWKNSDDEIVHVILTYQFPPNSEEDTSNLFCSLILNQPKGLYLKLLQNYKKQYPDLIQD